MLQTDLRMTMNLFLPFSCMVPQIGNSERDIAQRSSMLHRLPFHYPISFLFSPAPSKRNNGPFPTCRTLYTLRLLLFGHAHYYLSFSHRTQLSFRPNDIAKYFTPPYPYSCFACPYTLILLFSSFLRFLSALLFHFVAPCARPLGDMTT